MFSQVLWWLGIVLETLLLIRAAQCNFVKAYPTFYTYLAWVLVRSLVQFYVYMWHPAFYGLYYWYTQFVSVVLGCGVVWEICRQGLSWYPGAFRMARNVLLFILVVVLSKVLAGSLSGESGSIASTTAELERNLRAVQGFLILGIVGLFAYYRIPIGRNLRGMVFGYGFLVGTSIFNLTLRESLGEAFQLWWQYLQPSAYLVVLLIWCTTLWSYQPNPEPKGEPRIEQDYESLVGATRHRLVQMRNYVGRAVRP